MTGTNDEADFNALNALLGMEQTMNDMSEKVFEQQAFGKAALQKIGGIAENFRLYDAGWLGNGSRDTMRVTGAEFRVAKAGPNKGRMTVIVPNTKQTVYVTKAEMQPFLGA